MEHVTNDPVYFIPSDAYRFGGNDAEGKSHLFTYARFDVWCETRTFPIAITAECGATFHPQFMGVMLVGEAICDICAARCQKIGGV
jgi:hypothetical protein